MCIYSNRWSSAVSSDVAVFPFLQSKQDSWGDMRIFASLLQ